MGEAKVIDFGGNVPTQDDIFGDDYDVMSIGLQVHSAGTHLNPDFVVSDLDGTERRYIRRGLKIVELVEVFMDTKKFVIPQGSGVIKVGTSEDGRPIIMKLFGISQKEHIRIVEIKDMIVHRRLKDYKAMAVLSRGKDARMIKAIVSLISGGGNAGRLEEKANKEPKKEE